MDRASVGSQPALERYRSYLRLLAEARPDRRLRAKLDPSDIAQQTLLHAHRAWPQWGRSSEGELAAWRKRSRR